MKLPYVPRTKEGDTCLCLENKVRQAITMVDNFPQRTIHIPQSHKVRLQMDRDPFLFQLKTCPKAFLPDYLLLHYTIMWKKVTHKFCKYKYIELKYNRLDMHFYQASNVTKHVVSGLLDFLSLYQCTSLFHIYDFIKPHAKEFDTLIYVTASIMSFSI